MSSNSLGSSDCIKEKDNGPLGSDTSLGPELKSEENQTSKGGLQYYTRIFHYADRVSWTLNCVALIASIGSGSTLPLMTIIFGSSTAQFNDFAVAGPSSSSFNDKLHGYILLFVYLFLARLVLSYVATLSISIAAIRTTKAMRVAFLEHTLRQEAWYFDKQGDGAIASQVITNGNKINSGIAEKLSIFFQSLATFFAAFVVALAVQWKLTLITMSIIPAIFLFVSVCVPLDAIVESRVLKIYSAAAVHAEEAFSSVKTVHAFWAHEKIMEKYEHFLETAHMEGKKKSLIYAVLFSTQYFCVYCGIALAYWQGYRMYRNGEIPDVGKVFTVVLSMLIAAASISTIAPQFQAFTNASSAAAELFEVLDKPSQLDPLSRKGEVPTEFQGQIEIKNLKFSYPSRPAAAVLKGLSLSIPAGKTTALVGASGCGKSTIVGLLERWYEKDSGDISLNGDDITAYNTRWLRGQMGLVQQEPVLFHGTVFQNVANGLSDIQCTLPEEERRQLVREACVASNAHGFIEQLQDGYLTEVGESASTLSGGQRQRIAIARSIISNPKVLLLDEATSALDPESESVIQGALDKILVNRTALVIAHKLSTVRNADNIVVISDGVVVEQGNHDTLLHIEGRYAKLVAAQDLGRPEGIEDGQQREAPDITTRQAFAKESNGVTAEESLQPEQGTMGYSLVRCVWIMLSEQRSLYLCFFFAFTACLTAGATFPGQAILYSRVLAVFTLPPDEGQRQVNYNSLMFFMIALGNLLAYGTIGITCNIIGQQLTRCYRSEMLANILKQDIEFFDRPENTSGALTANITSLPSSLQDLISVNLLVMCIVVVNVISSSVVALAYGWKLGLVMVFGGFPLLLAAGYARVRVEMSLDSRNSERFSESASLASECVLAIKTVSSLTLEPLILEKYSDLLGDIVKRSIRSLLWNLWLYALSQSLELVIMPLGIWYGSRLVLRGEYTITQFYVIFVGVLFAGQAAAQFFSFTATITKATSAANYMLWLRTLKPTMQINPEKGGTVPIDGGSHIEFDAINFHYSQRSKNVLKNLSLTIPPGQFAAFVGPSGCGKSTMISLLERFYDPTSGTITFANNAVPTFSPRFYRSQISLVQQEPALFQGSIRENIAMGIDQRGNQDPPTEDQIIEACKQANAWDFIQSLPDGLATRCGSRGLQFSGGQKQRIAIARALIRKPRLLLLDEATSALDTESERLVQAALEKAAEGRTTIAVAHRLSTIKHADVIFVFGEGEIVEKGTHAELLGLRGKYFAMCEAQGMDMA